MTDAVKWVEVVSAEGEPLPGFEQPVPSHWLGTDLLPPGAKKKGRSSSSSSSSAPSGDSNPPADPNPVPAKSTSRADLEKYAVEHGGMTEEQAKGYGNADELHAALVAAKAAKS